MAGHAQFSTDDGLRIARAVKFVEDLQRRGGAGQQRAQAATASRKRWVGVARIVSDDGGGSYTVTVQRPAVTDSTMTLADRQDPSALVSAAAYDYLGRAGAAADAVVPYWEERTFDGEMVLLLDAAAATAGMLGVPTAAYSSGATITLDPCDAGGADNGQDNVTVQAGWTLPANTNIPTTAIIPYAQAADGNHYVIGQPREVMTNIQYDTTSHKLQKKVRYDWGAFTTTESSSWVDVTTAVDCTA